MRRFATRLVAEAIFVFHAGQICLVLVGWLLPDPYYYIYLADLSLAFLTQLYFRSCFLTTWEFYFRRMLQPELGPAPYYLTYYMHRYFPKLVTDEFVDRVSLIFMAVSLAFAALHLANDLH